MRLSELSVPIASPPPSDTSCPRSPINFRQKSFVRRQLAFEDDLHALRRAQPQLAGDPQRSDLASANAGAEGAQPAEMRGVRVGPEDGHAQQRQCFFAQDLVADAAPDLEEVAHALRVDELAHLSMVLGVLGSGGRRSVVERDAQSFGVFHPLNAPLPEQAVDGRGVVVAQHAVGSCIHDLASAHLGFAAARARAFSAKVLPIASGLHGHMQGKTLGGQTTAPSLAQSVVLPSMNTPFPLSALTNIFSGRPASKQRKMPAGMSRFL